MDARRRSSLILSLLLYCSQWYAASGIAPPPVSSAATEKAMVGRTSENAGHERAAVSFVREKSVIGAGSGTKGRFGAGNEVESPYEKGLREFGNGGVDSSRRKMTSLAILMAEWKSSASKMVQGVDDALLDIEGAQEKASALKPCQKHLEGCKKQLKRARRALDSDDPDFVTSKTRLLWAKDEVEQCLNAIDEKGSSGSSNYYGQAELQNARSRINSLYSSSISISEEERTNILLSGSPLRKRDVRYGGAKVKADDNNFYLPFKSKKYLGSRVRSLSTFDSGVFSARIRCPTGKSSEGLTTAFYLSTDAKDRRRSSIIMEFYGRNQSFVYLSTVRKGVMGATVAVYLGYDCSRDFHTYSIAWSESRIMWRNEKGMLRLINLKWWKEPLPKRPMHLYLELNPVNTMGTFQWPTKVKNRGVDFMAAFERVVVNSPIDNYNLPAFPTVPPHSPLYPIAVDYCLDHMKFGKNQVRIKFDSKRCGGRFRSTMNYLYGQFSAQIRCPRGNSGGLVSAFYLSTMEGSNTRDEIDFEFLGGYKTKILTNIYVNGVGNREKILKLGFDCSDDFHTYTIRYTKDSIVWFIDGEPVRQYKKKTERGYPNTPMFVYGSVWNASDFLLGKFAGKWSGADMPYYTTYRRFEINSPWLGRE